MTNQKKDTNALNDVFRQVRNQTRIHWNPTSSRNPADQQQDRDALNRAVRRAAGKDAPEPDAPTPFPWKSVGSEDRDDAA